MKDYLNKVKHILPIYLLAVFLSIFSLAILRYFLEVKLGLEINKITWELTLPFLFSGISIILIRKRFWVLEHQSKAKDTFIYVFICWILSLVLHVNSQIYLTKYWSKGEIVENIDKISDKNTVSKIKIEHYLVDTFYANYATDTRVEGKYDEDLVFTFYYTIAMVKDTLVRNDNFFPRVWYVNHFSKTVSNRLSDEVKYQNFLDFKKTSEDSLRKFNYYNHSYFEKVPNSREKQLYLSLISTLVGKNAQDNVILLTPSHKEDFNYKGKGSLIGFAVIFFMGIFTILFILIFPKYRNPNSIDYKNEEDWVTFVIKFLIPTKEFLVTPIIIDLNILVFLILCLFGVDPIEPNYMDLVKAGALTPDVGQGQFWRLITSLFLHAGVVHLVSNMIVLAIAGAYSEKIFGKLKFTILYFFAGILAAFSSLLWHINIIGVGASGAIFGVIGATAMTIILSHDWRKSQNVLVIIFAYVMYNLFMGMFGNTDNIAHISGLIFGAIFSMILYYYKEE